MSWCTHAYRFKPHAIVNNWKIIQPGCCSRFCLFYPTVTPNEPFSLLTSLNKLSECMQSSYMEQKEDNCTMPACRQRKIISVRPSQSLCLHTLEPNRQSLQKERHESLLAKMFPIPHAAAWDALIYSLLLMPLSKMFHMHSLDNTCLERQAAVHSYWDLADQATFLEEPYKLLALMDCQVINYSSCSLLPSPSGMIYINGRTPTQITRTSWAQDGFV